MVNKTHRRFIDTTRIRAAVESDRRATNAPIHVSIAPYFWGNVRKSAERAFRKHGFANTPERNAVLFFIVPSRREFAIIGDVAAHAAVGQRVWDATVAVVRESILCEDATSALLRGIETIDRALSEHFPRTQQTQERP